MNRRDPPGPADRSGLWGPAGHAVATGVLAAIGAGAATARGAPATEVWTGALLAWGIQAVSVWRLQSALAGGRPVTRAWVGGMAARLAGLVMVAAIASSTALDGAATAVAYVAAVIPLLWVEGLWLHRAATAPDPPTGPGAPPEAEAPDAAPDAAAETTIDEPTER